MENAIAGPSFSSLLMILLLGAPIFLAIFLPIILSKKRRRRQTTARKESIADELEKLAHLRENGSLNEEEYNTAKSKLLNNH